MNVVAKACEPALFKDHMHDLPFTQMLPVLLLRSLCVFLPVLTHACALCQTNLILSKRYNTLRSPSLVVSWATFVRMCQPNIKYFVGVGYCEEFDSLGKAHFTRVGLL